MATATTSPIIVGDFSDSENPVFIPCMTGGWITSIIELAGENPADYNRFRWPVGASDFGSVRVLIQDENIRSIVAPSQNPQKAFSLSFGEIVADRMYARDIRPINASNAPRQSTLPNMDDPQGGTFWSVLFVDERYYWNRANSLDKAELSSLAAGYNLYDQTRGAFLEGTSPGSDTPYTPREILDELLEALFANSLIDGTPSGGGQPDLTTALSRFDRTSTLLDAEDAIRDFWSDGTDDIGRMIDDIARMAGCYLTAFPAIEGSSPGGTGWGIPQSPNANGTFRYAFRSHRHGQGIVRNILNDTQSYKAGGWYGVAEDYGFVEGQIGYYATGDPIFLNAEIPERVAAYFPKAPSDGIRWDLFNGSPFSPGIVDAPTDRWEIVEETEGKPFGIDRQGVQTIHSTVFAQIDDTGSVLNASEIQSEAERLSSRYYDRFWAGVGNAILQGHVRVEPTGGMQSIFWSIVDSEDSYLTEIRGDFEWRGFGFSNQPRKLDRSDIMTAGTVRALPRADGRVLIDGIPQTALVYPAKITLNTGVGIDGGPIYDARADADPNVTVTDATPVNREFDPAIVTHVPEPIGAVCLIIQSNDGTRTLQAFEENPVQDCEDAGLGARIWFGT